MSRDEPRPEPSTATVRDAAMAALDRPVADVARIETGVNALFRIDLADGTRAVLKAPRYAAEPAFLVEPVHLSRIGSETDVPAPEILATVHASDGPLEVPFYLMTHLDGRHVDSPLELSSATRERLVREAGSHLAAIHEMDLPVTQWGHLEAPDGELRVREPFDVWRSFFDELAAEICDALRGEGPLTDEQPHFADIEPLVRETVTGDLPAATDRSPEPSLVAGDYRAANLLLAPRDDADPLVRGVIDVGGQVGDGLLDVALTEDALIDLPLGGTPEAESLRTAFRESYATSRSAHAVDRGTDRHATFDERYPYYRLYARARRLKAFDYSVQFARESDPDAVAHRCRSFVEDRVAEIGVE